MRYNSYWAGLIAVTLFLFVLIGEKGITHLFESEYSFSVIESGGKLTTNGIEGNMVRMSYRGEINEKD